MKKWLAWVGLLCVVAVFLLAAGSSEGSSSYDEGALEEAISQRNEATSEWVSYSGEVEQLEEELDDVSTRLEIEEWAMGSNTAKAKQLQQDKSRIQASLDLATFKMEQASATMDHYSQLVEELEATKGESVEGVGSLTIFGVIVGVAAVCCLFAGLVASAKKEEEE